MATILDTAALDSGKEGNGNPLQYSCLENPVDREVWQATLPGVAKGWTWLSDLVNVSQKLTFWLLWSSLDRLQFWATLYLSDSFS